MQKCDLRQRYCFQFLGKYIFLRHIFAWSSHCTWWHHQMETFCKLLALYEWNPLVTDGFPSQRPAMRSFDVFFDQRLNKQLSKQSRCWWFEMPSHSLWCHCNDGMEHCMMTSSYGNILHVTGPLWVESTGHRWIPLTKASNAKLWCFLWSVPEQTVEQTIKMLVIWDAITLFMISL